MNELMNAAEAQTIDSQTLLKMVNEARKLCGENEIENRKLVAKIEDELEGEVFDRKKNSSRKYQ